MVDVNSIKIELEQGNCVYVINDFEQLAMCYDPKHPLKVSVKIRNGKTLRIDPRDVCLYDATVEGEVVSEEDYNEF